jgi:hypothetical protein
MLKITDTEPPNNPVLTLNIEWIIPERTRALDRQADVGSM